MRSPPVGGGVARAEDPAALGDLVLEVVWVERVVRREEAPAAGVAREAEQPQQQLLREVPAVPVPRHAPRHPLDPPLLFRGQRRRRAVVVHRHRRRRIHRAVAAGRCICDEGTGRICRRGEGEPSVVRVWIQVGSPYPDLVTIYSPGREGWKVDEDRWRHPTPVASPLHATA